MIMVALVLLWLASVNLCAHFQKDMSAVRFYSYLLGRWPGEPDSGRLSLALLGRVGLALLCVILAGLVWRQTWRDSLISLILLAAGLAAVRFWLEERKVLPGLIEIRTLLRWPDGYRCLTGRVAGGGPLAGASLADLDLRRRGWLVLAIMHGGFSCQFPKGQETLMDGDLLLIYGRPEES